MRAGRLDQAQVTFCDQGFWFLTGDTNHVPVRIRDKRRPPELHMVFGTDAIGGNHIDSVGDRVGTHHGVPSIPLAFTELGFLRCLPSDRRWVNQKISAGQGRKSGRFGEPLIPANANANFSDRRFEAAEACVTRREIEFFIKVWIVWDVHLPIDARDTSIIFNHDRSVVKQPGCAAFEQSSHDHDVFFLGNFAQSICRRSGNRLGPCELIVVLRLTEVRAGEQFLQTDQLSPFGGSQFDLFNRAVYIFNRVVSAVQLNGGDGDSLRLMLSGSSHVFFQY